MRRKGEFAATDAVRATQTLPLARSTPSSGGIAGAKVSRRGGLVLPPLCVCHRLSHCTRLSRASDPPGAPLAVVVTAVPGIPLPSAVLPIANSQPPSSSLASQVEASDEAMVPKVRSPRARGKLVRESAKKLAKKLGTLTKSTHTKVVKAKPKPKAKTIRRVRVWWPPTKNRSKSDVSGMFWPARLIAQVRGSDKGTVEYDNEDVEIVLFSNCQPANVPVDFGAEKEPFKPGEFVEVSNNSKTDPATWFAKIVEVKKTNCMVEYPFCDGPAELKKMEHIRRARIFDEDKNAWCYVDPAQKWKDGKFSSPMEAKLVSKAELDKWRASVEAKQTQKKAASKKAAPAKKAAPKKTAPKSTLKSSKAKKALLNGVGPAIQKPSRAKSAYLVFCDSNRAAVRFKHPDLPMAEVTKVLGEMWHKVSEKEKKKFEAEAKTDQERFAREQEVYLSKHKEAQAPPAPVPHPVGFGVAPFHPAMALHPGFMPPRVVGNGGEEKLRKPTIAKTEIQLYMSAQKKALKDKFTKEGALESWEKADKATRAPFVKQAREAKKVYEAKMADYEMKKKQRSAPMAAPPMPMAPPVAGPSQVAPGNPPVEGALHPAAFAPGMGMHPGHFFVHPGPPLITPTQFMDMDKLRRATKRLASEDTYYQVIDHMRPDSPNFQKAVQASHAHVIGQKKPDYKGFLVQLFGIKVLKK